MTAKGYSSVPKPAEIRSCSQITCCRSASKYAYWIKRYPLKRKSTADWKL